MGNILKSAGKVVFVAITLTACLAFVFQIFMGRVVLESKDFMLLAMTAFTFYFTVRNGNSNEPDDLGGK